MIKYYDPENPKSPRQKIRAEVFIGPSEWAADPGWYELVVDGELTAQIDWKRFKQLLDEEAGAVDAG